MHNIKSKKTAFLILAVILLISIIIISYLILFKLNDVMNSTSETKIFTKEVKELSDKHTNSFNNNQVDAALRKINNQSLSEKDRYDALVDLSFYYAVAYSNGHSSEVRAQNNVVSDYARENYSNFYDENYFSIPCADPECGEKPDEIMQEILKNVKVLKIEDVKHDTILKNLDTAIFMPANEVLLPEKLTAYSLVINQLQFENNQQASNAALLLIDYLKIKYNYKYIDRSSDVTGSLNN